MTLISQKNLTLLLPTLNEKENIVPQIAAILEVIPFIGEILVVDDSSTDGTLEVVVSHYPERVSQGQIRTIKRTSDFGLTASLKEGIKQSRFPLVGWMDCDLSMPAELLLEFINEIREGADLALGSRFLKGGRQKDFSQPGKDSRAAIVLSNVLNRLLSKILCLPFTDFTSGFVIARKASLQSERWGGKHGEYFIEMLFDAHRSRARVVEIPYDCGTRRFGESKTFGTAASMMRNSLRYLSIVLRLLRGNPSSLFPFGARNRGTVS